MKDEDPMVDKTCTECQQEYTPTSNRQQVCQDCRSVHESMGEPCTDIPGNSVRIVEVAAPAVTLEAIAREVMRLTGCKDLTLNYTDVILHISNHL